MGGGVVDVVSSRPLAGAYRVELTGDTVTETPLPVRFPGAADATAAAGKSHA
jgi:hypothetical protein